ncbi:MAG: glycine/betaine/sarcosine/D-proline family reductase selenoprotein B, partial [Desulfobacterales bacterium]|nr:glycine/betaine/sarcosine/D-proline family reductase selenoprotein B [Desulfobacterales bacterium]
LMKNDKNSQHSLRDSNNPRLLWRKSTHAMLSTMAIVPVAALLICVTAEQTFALVTSGGLFLKDSQPAFDTVSIHGDPSLREIPKTVSQGDIGIAHAQYDHSLAEKDINIIFPIHRMIELEEEKIIGRVVATNYSFSYVNDVVTLVTETIPKFISRIKADGVDVVLLVPV